MSGEEDEAATLSKANAELRSELEMLRKRVEELREIRCEDVEEFDEEAELLRLENDLLKAQLLEQQQFLEGCRLLATQMAKESEVDKVTGVSIPPSPRTAAIMTADAKRELVRQGADNALTKLFHLVSRSQQINSWTGVKLPEHVFKSAVPGLNVTCCYRKEKHPDDPGVTTLILRVDGCYPNISPAIAQQGYWSTWVSAESWATVFSNFFGQKDHNQAQSADQSNAGKSGDKKSTASEDGVTVHGKTPIPFHLKELMSARDPDGGEVKVNLYREMPPNDSPRDWVYVMTRQQRDIAMSTLSMAPELTPGVAARREQHSRRVVPQSEKPRRKRAKATGSASAAQLIGREKCYVLARNYMRSMTVDDSGALVGNRMDAENRLVEGLFVWQDYVSIDVEVPCAEGKEIRRQRVPAARAAAFIAVTDDLFPVQEIELHNAIVDASGKATEKYAKLIDMFYAVMMAGGV